MKAAIYNPYWDTLGGGERYTLSVAKILSEELGYDVYIEWNDTGIKKKLEDRFGFKLSSNIQFIKDVERGESYDLIFWVSDGSLPILRARYNIIHFQVPFKGVGGRSLFNKMKLFRVDNIICNSLFTKKVVDDEYGVISSVLYPPVDVNKFKPKLKENIILYVGRFSNLVQNKGHEILISAFNDLIKLNKFKDWKLIFAGGTEVGSDKYLSDLKEKAQGLNIQFYESPDFDTLRDLYGRSKIYWSAAGYGVDQLNEPQKTEHFGITLVEAMSSGCVPIVFKSGGALEIINDGINGMFWENIESLVKLTEQVIDGQFKKTSNMAIARSKDFDYSTFTQKIKEILNK